MWPLKFKLTGAHVSVITGNILAFISGVSSSWTSPTIPKLICDCTEDYPFNRPVTEDELAWISSLMNLGAVFGSLVVGLTSENVSRKATITCIGTQFVIAYTMLALGNNVYVYMVARVLVGFPVGATAMILPTYIGEISPDRERGWLLSSTKSFVLFGILFSYSLGPFIKIGLFNFFIMLVAVFFIPIFYCGAQESPYYLFSRNKTDKALESLKKLRGNFELSLSDAEVTCVQETVRDSMASPKMITYSIAVLRAVFTVACLLILLQLSGINQILQRSQRIFEMAAIKLSPEICAIILGSMQFVSQFLTSLLYDRIGRRILLYISSSGTSVTLAILGLYFYMKESHLKLNINEITYVPLACLLTYICIYNCGMAAIPWTVMGELFPTQAKLFGSSICTAIYYLFGFIITFNFTVLREHIGLGGSFWIFSGFCFITNIFVYFFLIETKGKSLEEIQIILRSPHKI